MKKVKLIILIMVPFLLTGCIHKYTLSDNQENAAAEYMAGVVLKYDKNYKDKLLVTNKMKERLIKVTQAESMDEENNQVSQSTTTDTNESNSSNADTLTPNTGETRAIVKESNATLTQTIGKENFDVIYKNYKLYDTYPENSDSTNFSLDPGNNSKLLVATFTVKNTSDSTNRLNLIRSNINYQLDVNDGTMYKPLLTLLENDLRYIDVSLEKGKTKDVVLIFEVSKKVNMSDINLIVSRGTNTNIIELR